MLSSSRRALGAVLSVMLATAGLGLAFVVWATPAQAVTLTCGTAAENVAALRSAMTDAKLSRAASIDLASDCSYVLTDADANGIALLPTVTNALTIRGHGATISRDPSAPAKPIFLLETSTPRLGLDHVTLSGGDPAIRTYGTVDLTSSTLSGNSGGVESFGGVVTVASSTVTANKWPQVFLNSGGTLGISSTDVHHNSQAGACGSGVIVENINGAAATVTGSVFSDNSGCSTTFGMIDNGSGSTTTVTDSQFLRNSATNGGAIFNDGTMTVARTLFRANTASYGGAIVSEGDSLSVTDSWFDQNSGAIEGGAMKVSGAASVTGSTFSGNLTQHDGAAIYLYISGSTLAVENSTFASNLAGATLSNGFGAGLYVDSGAATLTSTTFTRNRVLASGRGSALYNDEGSVTVATSLFDSQSGGLVCSGAITDAGYNVASSGCASGFAGGSVTLLPVSAASGGPTPTAALGAGSSAAVDQVPAASCLATDQRGVARPQGSACDVGAWEDQAPGAPGVPALSGSSSPTAGVFTLAWSPASDPDGTAVSYELWKQDADDLTFSKVATTSAATYTFTSSAPEAEGTLGYRVVATDGNLGATSPVSADVVVDRSAPSAPAASPDRAPDADATGESDDWYLDQVVVTFASGADPALADGSPGSGVATTTAAVTVDTSGAHEVQGTSTDVAGNVSAVTSLTVRVDADAPVVGFGSCPATVVLGAAAQASWSAADASSGLAGASSGAVSLPASTVGAHTVSSPTVSDRVGHTAHADCSYQVVFAFTGFLAPVANAPAYNKVSAGRPVTVSFALGGDQGLNVLAPGYPQTAPIACGTTALLDAGAPMAAPRLTYAPSQGGRYSITLGIDQSWSGTCRQLIVKLSDGTFHRANFRVK